MNIKKRLDELLKLYEIDNLIKLDRKVDIGKYVPQDIIGKGKEFTHIRLRDNEELSRLFEMMFYIIENTYIKSSDKLGIDSYIKMIDEDIRGDLEEKRKGVFAKWNQKTIWTHRTLLEYMDDVVGKGLYKIVLHYNEYGIDFEIELSKAKINIGYLEKSLRFIIPANLWIRWIFYERMKTYLASTNITGETAKILPFMIREIESRKGKILASTNLSAEDVKIYPVKPKKKKTLDCNLFLDDGLYLDEN